MIKITEWVLSWRRKGNTTVALVVLQALVGAGALSDGRAVAGISIEAAARTLAATLHTGADTRQIFSSCW